MNSQDVSAQIAEDMGIKQESYDGIVKALGRQPNFLELQIYSVMWSENISYRSSFSWLKKLPSKKDYLLVGVGEGSAGVVDMGNGYCCVFKMGTHNHPSGIDPNQGAATCVGDVCRDVLCFGARPVVMFNSLCFGDTGMDRTHWLMEEVMNGIDNYCSSLEIINKGGDIRFHSCYDTNPLVNVMVAGVVKSDNLLLNKNVEVGQQIYIVGDATGKAGVYGGSEDFTIPSSNAQLAKGVMESIVELNEKGLLVRVENMDMAGIVSACACVSAHSNKGVVVDLDLIPLQEVGMLDEEILLSRTQERILMIVDQKNITSVEDVFKKKQLTYARIGQVDQRNRLRFYHGESCVAELPAGDLVMGFGAPQDNHKYKPSTIQGQEVNTDVIPEPDDYWKVINTMVGNPNVVIKEYLQISHEGKGVSSPSDAFIIPLGDGDESLCFALSGNSIYSHSNSHVGAQINVAKAVRRIVCSGGRPLALNDCLNFGSVLDPLVYAQFVETVEGIAHACSYFDIPVAGGNVSFFNESSENGKRKAIYPTPVIGMMGVISPHQNHMSYIFRNKGDMIFLIGRSRNDISGSEYVCSVHKIDDAGVPYFDIEKEVKVNDAVSNLIKKKLISSAHSVGRGGLFFNLLESSMPLGWGFDITSPAEVRTDAFLFGEAQGRVVVSVARQQEDAFVDFMIESKLPFSTIGHVTKGELRIDDISYGFIEEYKEKYQQMTVLK